MLRLLARHGLLAVLVAVVVEELGVPMPIPTDVMIVFTGAREGGSAAHLAGVFAGILLASALGASGLYAIVRRGGRPLVERYGRYVRLGPEQLARSEALLARGGWWAIALGRAIPGLRYATVVACGLFEVPYLRFLTAHLAGSSLYIVIFLALGAVFGPAVLERIHPSALALRMLWLLPLAVGLPLLMIWWGTRARRAAGQDAPSSRRTVAATLLGGFAGTAALAAAWATTATVAELWGVHHPLYAPLGRFSGASVEVSVLLHAALLALFVVVAVVYHALVLPYLAPRGATLPRQALYLALLVLGPAGAILVVTTLAQVAGGSSGDVPAALLGLALGVAAYAPTAVYAAALVSTATATLRRAP
jgi:membrane protein DedA with SNARE-associated domain